jgi:hypothetical protein
MTERKRRNQPFIDLYQSVGYPAIRIIACVGPVLANKIVENNLKNGYKLLFAPVLREKPDIMEETGWKQNRN